MQIGEILFLGLLGGYLATVSGLIDPSGITSMFSSGSDDDGLDDDLAEIDNGAGNMLDDLPSMTGEDDDDASSPYDDEDAAGYMQADQAFGYGGDDADQVPSGRFDHHGWDEVDRIANSIFGGLGGNTLLSADYENAVAQENARMEVEDEDFGYEDDETFYAEGIYDPDFDDEDAFDEDGDMLVLGPEAEVEDDAAAADDEDEDEADNSVASLASYAVDDASPEASHIHDFDPSHDVLRIEFEADVDPETGDLIVPEVEVNYDEDADVTRISLDGSDVITLDGNAGITKDDVVLEAVA